MDDDLLEFYNVAQELEVYGADNEVLAERVFIIARIGKIVFLWVCPALGIIWGFSQGGFLESRDNKNASLQNPPLRLHQ
jgi:hypothetical protein